MKSLSALVILFALVTVPAVAAPCHPDLFHRAESTVGVLEELRTGRFAAFKAAIARHPNLEPGQSITTEGVRDGIIRQFTMTLNGDGSYSFELQVGVASAEPTLVTIVTANLATSTDATSNVTQETGNLTVDFDAWKSVMSTVDASGQVAAIFNTVTDPNKPAPGIKTTATVLMTNLLFEPNDPHGARNGSYNLTGEPGIGGAFSYSDSLTLLCPTNPGNLVSDETVVERWYTTSAGSQNTRADAMATGGPIPPGDQWISLQCAGHRFPTPPGYFLFKLEGPDGNTITGKSGGSGNCDPAFGPPPALSTNATDYNFAEPPTFPNEY